MLRVFDGNQPMNRRELLRIGGLGLGGLSLSSLLGTKALASGKLNPLTGKSVIFLFQQGGPSQFETFDPKPEAPSGIRTVGDVIPTSLPGVRFGATMQQLAKLGTWTTESSVSPCRQCGTKRQPGRILSPRPLARS